MAWIRIPAKNGCSAVFFPSSKFVAAHAMNTSDGRTLTEIFLDGKPFAVTVGFGIEEVFSYFDKNKTPEKSQ